MRKQINVLTLNLAVKTCVNWKIFHAVVVLLKKIMKIIALQSSCIYSVCVCVCVHVCVCVCVCVCTVCLCVCVSLWVCLNDMVVVFLFFLSNPK